MSSNAILKCEKVTKIYRRGRSESVYALKDIDLEIRPGEIIMIAGPSGSGKTTLLNILSGLDKPTKGKIFFNISKASDKFKVKGLDEEPIKKQKFIDITQWDEKQLTEYRRYNVGFIFQAWELIPTLKAIENVESSLYPLDIPIGEIRERAKKLFRKVQLFDKENAFPDQLSGGEQQRVAICRALIKEPKIVFADEPTGNLDSETGEQILRQMKLISREGAAVVLSTHNLELRKFADRVIRLHDGQITY
ncbi:MAG: ABC transporter ATP-binding protein [Candidatus Heimdallarchaeaceae archaeon]